MATSKDVMQQQVAVLKNSRNGLTSNALPEVFACQNRENANNGVSTKNALMRTTNSKSTTNMIDEAHWYVLRCTYGLERKAYQYMTAHGIEAFYPTLKKIKIIKGTRKEVEESRIPNIFFAYGTEDEIKSFVYDNVNLPFLRFYYEKFSNGRKTSKRPLLVPNDQMEGLKTICAAESEDIIITTGNIPKFQSGDMVRVIQGKFKGIIGRVARYHGQQRVAIIINGFLTAATAYVPNAYLERIPELSKS